MTGVLPIALNRACKLTGWFMKKNKGYVGIMKLHKDIDEDKLKREMQKFIGRIKQLPPVKSRVRRQERQREVYRWQMLEFDKQSREVLFECDVEAGTYVRKMISDLGLKVGGAHMTELRRTKAGIFSEAESVNLYELEKAIEEYKEGKEDKLRKILIPGEIISKILPVVQIKSEAVKKLLTGKPIFKDDLTKKIKEKQEKAGESVAVFSEEKFIEVARVVEEGEIIARPEFVLN